MSTSTDDITSISTCANCGRGEESTGDLKGCTACKVVKYCNRDCQIAHRPQHKKECRKRAAELHDEALFKQPPQNEDCPICFLRLPTLESGYRHKTCCGKRICSGCIHAVCLTTGDNICPFCRAPLPNEEEGIKQAKKRVEIGDVEAIYGLGCFYDEGRYGLPQNREKALELWHRAAELGHARSCCSIGINYWNGRGVKERDTTKGKHYWELGAMGGNTNARYNLGFVEYHAGNMDRSQVLVLGRITILVIVIGMEEALKGIKRRANITWSFQPWGDLQLQGAI